MIPILLSEIRQLVHVSIGAAQKYATAGTCRKTCHDNVVGRNAVQRKRLEQYILRHAIWIVAASTAAGTDAKEHDLSCRTEDDDVLDGW